MMANIGIGIAVRQFLFGRTTRGGRAKDERAMPVRGGNTTEHVTVFPGAGDAWRLLR